jgi:hypothetical protein
MQQRQGQLQPQFHSMLLLLLLLLLRLRALQ